VWDVHQSKQEVKYGVTITDQNNQINENTKLHPLGKNLDLFDRKISMFFPAIFRRVFSLIYREKEPNTGLK
jgi:hypothetical protein